MIFSEQSIKNIAAGRKIGTTRVSSYWGRVKGPIAIQPPKDPGEPGRGKKAVGYIGITSVSAIFTDSQLKLHALQVWKDEGFESSQDLYRRFRELKLHKALKKNGVLYYYQFEYLGREKPK